MFNFKKGNIATFKINTVQVVLKKKYHLRIWKTEI